MTTLKSTLAACAAILLLAGCGAPASKPQADPQQSAAPTAPSSAAQSPAPASVLPLPTSDAPQGLLQAVQATAFADHDQLVFAFGGTKASVRRIEFVSEVREDPSDRPVSLAGNSFLVVVFDGTLDTAGREPDPGKARKYTGPTRITPGLPVLKEVAAAGDFEFVLSFGVGMGRPACVTAKTQTGPARLVLDLWHDRAHQPADAACSGTVKVQR
ncbi:AMIN-like domain-containing (lipo)protein [Rhizocola hellebori]|nr:hypothetical protein [Rhizocola hellebori]